jgi:hypothetical protein
MRSASSVIAFWAGVVVLAIIVGTSVVTADWRLFAFLIAPALLLAWAFWVVLFRPAVRYDAARVTVINVGRRHVLPWGHVKGVRQALALTFDLDAGKPVQAWGVPARRQRGLIAGTIDRRTRPTVDLNSDAEILDGVRGAALASDEPIVSRFDTLPLVIGAVLIVAVIIEFAVGI